MQNIPSWHSLKIIKTFFISFWWIWFVWLPITINNIQNEENSNTWLFPYIYHIYQIIFSAVNPLILTFVFISLTHFYISISFPSSLLYFYLINFSHLSLYFNNLHHYLYISINSPPLIFIFLSISPTHLYDSINFLL